MGSPSGPGRPFDVEWLAALCGSLRELSCGVVLRRDRSGKRVDVFSWPEGAAAAAALEATARAALGQQAPVAQGREPSAGQPVGSVRLALPFRGSDGNLAALAVEIDDAKVAEVSRWIDRLHVGLAPLVALERHRRAGDGLRIAMAALAAGLEPADADASLLAIASALVEGFDCERVAIGTREGSGARVRALSRCAEIGASSSAARDLAHAMDEACDQDASVAYPPEAGAPPRVDRAHAALVSRSGGGAAWTVPLPARGELVGAITFEHRSGRTHDPETIRRSEDVATLLGPLVALQRAAEAGAWTRLRKIAARRLDPAALGLDRRQARAVVIGGVLALFVAALAPTPYEVRAHARLEGRIERALVAGIDGFLVEVEARPGDVVGRHQLLARLDDRDLLVERRKWEGNREELRRQHREALADHERAEASVLGARMAQAEAELDLLDATLARTEIRAPFDGVIVRGDPTDKLGAPVSKSDVLYELAPVDGYRVVLDVDEREIAYVESGQRGRVALSALPGETLVLIVERVTPVAVARDGHNSFRVEAHVDQPSPSLRPGMEGVARIETAPRSRLWIWGHGLVDGLRLAVWSWWP